MPRPPAALRAELQPIKFGLRWRVQAEFWTLWRWPRLYFKNLVRRGK